METGCGEHIGGACRRAVAIATERGDTITFDFNGVTVTALPGSDPAALERMWEADMERKGEEYRRTPEYAETQRRLETKKAAAQEAVNDFAERLPALLGDERALVLACGDYADAQDWTGLDRRASCVVPLLKRAGYAANDCVEHPKVTYDRTIFARWLIGQVLVGLEKDHPIWPGLKEMARDYDRIPFEPGQRLGQ